MGNTSHIESKITYFIAFLTLISYLDDEMPYIILHTITFPLRMVDQFFPRVTKRDLFPQNERQVAKIHFQVINKFI